MQLTIAAQSDVLRAMIAYRHTADETRSAVDSIMSELEKSGLKKLLIVVRDSPPIFRVDQYELSKFIAQATALEGLRVALVADTSELYASHQYIELLARQRGIEIRPFRDEAKALSWLVASA